MTGIAYKNDPTIIAWETSNELKPPTSWTQTISGYIKNIVSRQLVIDGRSGIDPAAISLTHVDIVSVHYYPKNAAQVKLDAASASRTDKAFYIGEFDWNDTNGGDALASFLTTIESIPGISGDAYWNLWSHDDASGYFKGEAKYALYYPGTTDSMRNSAQLLRTHAYKMSGRPLVGDGLPGVPLIEEACTYDQHTILKWRGATLAAAYTIERSTAGPQGPWTAVCARCVTDAKPLWIDPQTPPTVIWYRMMAYNRAAVAGKPSLAYQAKA